MPKDLIATDPPVSEAQRRAMEAAAHGRSTLGIPKKVGEEFVGADARPDAGHAAGILFVAPDGDVLLLRRSSAEQNYGGHWALPGGKAEDGETPEEAARREATEELGIEPPDVLRLLDARLSGGGMPFRTFASPATEKFAPTLNDEHSGFCWAPLDALPAPLHPGVAVTIAERLGGDRDLAAEDMTPEDWGSLRSNFAKWTREEEAEAEHAPAADARLDRKSGVAWDRATVRSVDEDGHLHVKMTPISKANVCPYNGSEIPDAERLGLDPNKVYRLLRDPEELARGAATFAGKPLMIVHIPVNADDHPREKVVGSVGTEVEFKKPYLMAPLTVWDGEAIGLIDSEEQKELSSAYHYEADMTPGEYDGESYDGVMRNIRGNHVALVEEGRAGPDVVVGDSKHQQEQDMTTKQAMLSGAAKIAFGAIYGYVRPRLAADAKIDLKPALKGVTAKNWPAKKAQVAADVKRIAKDAKLDDIHKLMDSLDPEMEAAADESETMPPRGGNDEDPKKAFLRERLNAEDMKAYDAMEEQEAMDRAARDSAEEEDEAAKKKKAAEDAENDDDDEPKVTKKAMDEAIARAVTTSTKLAEDNVRKAMREISDTEDFIRPWVGKLAVANDSAEGLLRSALVALGMDSAEIEGLPAKALRAILKAQPLPGSARSASHDAPRLASDAAPAGYGFGDMFPAAVAASRA